MKKTILTILFCVCTPVFFVNIAAQGPGAPVLTEPGKAAIAEVLVSHTGHSDGNTDQLTITVERETLAVNPTTHSSEICLNDTTQLYANASGGYGDYTYSWTSEPEGFTSAEANPLVVPQETTIYSVTVSDENNNQASGTVTVTVHPLPAATASSNSPVCEGQTIELYGGPDGMASYSWTGPDLYMSSQQNPTREDATYAMDGQYTLKVTDDNGCEALATIAVVVHPLPEAPTVTGSSPICEGDDAVFTISGTAGLQVTYNINGIEDTATIGAAGTVEVIVNAATEDQTITIIEVEDDNCTLDGLNITYTVVVHPLPEAPSLDGNDPICYGDDAIFTITGTPGLWVTYEIDGSEAIITIGAGGTVDVTVAAATEDQTITITKVEDDHCKLENLEIEHTIVVHELPQFTIEGPNMVCPNLKNAEYEADIINFPLTDIELPPEWVVVNGDIEHRDSNKAWISWHNKPGEQGKITLTVKNKHTGCERTLFNHSITFSSHHQAPEPEEIVNKTLNDKTVILIYPEPNLVYQWFKNDTEMTGEIGQYYYPGSMGFSPGDEYKVLVEPLNVNDFLCGNFSEPVTILEPKLYDFNPHDVFLMYPNPAGDHIVIVLNEEHENMSYNNCKAIIYNESGAFLKSQPLNQWENHLSVSELPAGVYLVAIWVNGNREIKRMIKK